MVTSELTDKINFNLLASASFSSYYGFLEKSSITSLACSSGVLPSALFSSPKAFLMASLTLSEPQSI